MKKLTLAKESLRRLNADESAEVAGGLNLIFTRYGCTSLVDACPTRITCASFCCVSIPLCATLPPTV